MDTAHKVALGLFGAWCANDLEELLTMRVGSADALARIPAWVPLPPELRTRGFSQAHVSTAIGVMGVVMAGCSVLGARTGFRDPVSRAVLDGFGVHGFGHIAASIAQRGYTTGVLTSPTVVIPFWWWASRQLRADGVAPQSGSVAAGCATAGVAIGTIVGIHVLTYRLLGERSLGS